MAFLKALTGKIAAEVSSPPTLPPWWGDLKTGDKVALPLDRWGRAARVPIEPARAGQCTGATALSAAETPSRLISG